MRRELTQLAVEEEHLHYCPKVGCGKIISETVSRHGILILRDPVSRRSSMVMRRLKSAPAVQCYPQRISESSLSVYLVFISQS